jgi:hypothetical protein
MDEVTYLIKHRDEILDPVEKELFIQKEQIE